MNSTAVSQGEPSQLLRFSRVITDCLIREDEKFQMLFKKAGFRLVKSDMQRGFPVVKDLNLLPMKMYALRPETGSEA